MGIYLDSKTVYHAYKEVYHAPYFVDKTRILREIIPRMKTPEKYICITRPRRFGKTVMANMISAFLSKGCKSEDVFQNLEIAKEENYKLNLNQHHVFFISLNELPSNCTSYRQYIERIEKRLKKDLKRAFSDTDMDSEDAVWDILRDVYEENDAAQFVFVLDEWDFIFHQNFVTEQDKKDYISFLSNLLKDKAYVSLVYMTGILPIAKYSSGSELNMFLEYTMATKEKYSAYFGFTDEEVDRLYTKYLKIQSAPGITREGLRLWYDGYQTPIGIRIYNPHSVICALRDNQLGGYWTSSGPYDEIYYYIKHNIDAVRDDLAKMMAGIPVMAKIQEYAAVSMNLTTKDEIFSAMVVYGFLSYEAGYVSIPNKELMDKFREMLMKEASLGYINRLAKESERMLNATLAGDAEIMAEILEYAHNTETPLLKYNSEAELTMLVNLVYLQARDFYRIEREDKAGIGYVGFIFYPEMDRNADCIILELKVNHTAGEALQQIKNKKYALKFEGKLGEDTKYTGRILGVGIAYDRERKTHECKIEVLRGALK